jgi:C-terminal processing protease CtpA/Prc
MALLVDTKALVIDLRHCGGGDPESVMLFASYLYDKPTHLNDVYWRDENRTEQRWTQASVVGTKYGEARKVYLLTSGDTFSGCEDFAYALKNNKRATLVGETTGGGAHAGGPHRLDAHFMMFVPSGRPINPVTHTDWEGVGVAPDIKASAKNALDVAQVAALKAMIPVETDPVWRKKLQERLHDLD